MGVDSPLSRPCRVLPPGVSPASLVLGGPPFSGNWCGGHRCARPPWGSAQPRGSMSAVAWAGQGGPLLSSGLPPPLCCVLPPHCLDPCTLPPSSHRHFSSSTPTLGKACAHCSLPCPPLRAHSPEGSPACPPLPLPGPLSSLPCFPPTPGGPSHKGSGLRLAFSPPSVSLASVPVSPSVAIASEPRWPLTQPSPAPARRRPTAPVAASLPH